MDDYRSGYADGIEKLGPIDDPNDAASRCAEVMAAEYGVSASEYGMPGPPAAFWWGCYHAVNGLKSDAWNVSGWLTA
jgi:hypothetical protein